LRVRRIGHDRIGLQEPCQRGVACPEPVEG
jgi:hypothetical protein